MASEIKLFEMTKKDMRHLTETSIIALLASVLISCLSTMLLHLYSERQSITTQTPVPSAFVITDLTINMFIVLFTIMAIYAHLTTRQLLEDRQKHFNRVLLLLLIASLSFAMPFRSLAEVIRGSNGLPSFLFLMCSDVVAAVGSSFLLIFLWTYPSIWATPSERTIHPYKTCACMIYAVLRFAISFAFRIHFESLPVHHLFSMAAIFARDRNVLIKPVSLGCIFALSSIECVVIFCIYWNYLSSSAILYSANDRSKHQGVIALWYYRRAVVFLSTSTFAAAVARILSPATQAINLLREYSVIILSSPLGNSAVSLAILSYALREVYVHRSSEEKDVPFALALFIGQPSLSREKTWKEVDENLLYRIADERDPQNEDPVPQPNTFSFESAMLLFNTAWLATTYGTKGIKPLTPSDFGRPMCAVRAVISDVNNTVVVIVLERMDRLVVAFKPVLPGVESKDFMRSLPQTDLGRSFLQNHSEDQELLPLRELKVPIEKLFKQCKLHSGFTQEYSSIQTELHARVRDLSMDTSRPLYITGFGSGGALATICAFDFCVRKISETNAVSLYTYGSPRALSLGMATLFETLVPCRWRCVVAGDCNTVKPCRSSYRHFSKVATFTRSGHLALECNREYKWWQSEVSTHPMHKISAYYCAFAKWHKAYHVKGSIDLWDWQIDRTVAALFSHDPTPSDLMSTDDFLLESPITDVEAKSLRTVGGTASWPSALLDDVIAFKR